jgi:prepilin peptidase CpaA
MNLIVGAPIWLVAILFIALAGAAIEDAVRLRISNLTCGAIFLAAVVAMALQGFSLSLWQNAVICLAILAVGMPAFAAGWFGGGDIKLLAAIGLWLDLNAAVGLVSAVFMAGGIVAIVYITARRVTRPNAPRSERARIPYGLAIVFGAILIFGIQLSQPPTKNSFIDHMKAVEAQHRRISE